MSESFVMTADGVKTECDPAILTVLNFSGGKQSTCILQMVLDGDIKKPSNFIVLNADPGMEDSTTYSLVEKMKEECLKVNIPFETVKGKNLFDDLLNSKGETRLDNPPFWTLDQKGKRGRLNQKCTVRYKIEPMDRAIRKYMEEYFGISRKTKRIPFGCVEKWIGFTKDEMHRMKPPKQKYIRFKYPLAELNMKKEDTVRWFIQNGYPVPNTSVCNACFANDASHFEKMYYERPEDWKQAIEVDEAIRDLRHVGIKDTCYVYNGCIPLTQLAEMGFPKRNSFGDSCDSGYCFT